MLTKFTDKFENAIMAKPKSGAYIKSLPSDKKEKLLQAMFTEMLSKELVASKTKAKIANEGFEN